MYHREKTKPSKPQSHTTKSTKIKDQMRHTNISIAFIIAATLVLIFTFHLHDVLLGKFPPIVNTFNQISNTIKVWQSNNFSEHLFLIYETEKLNSYPSMSYFGGIAFVLYHIIFIKIMPVSEIWSVLFASFVFWVFVSTWIWKSSNIQHSSTLILSLIISNILFFTSPTVIKGMYTYVHAHPWFITGIAAFVCGYWKYIDKDLQKIMLFFALIILSLFGHLTGIAILLALYITEDNESKFKKIFLVYLLFSILNIFIPYALSNGLPTSSSFWARSGLDGNRQFVTSIIQAVIEPFETTLPARLQTFLIPLVVAISILTLYGELFSRDEICKIFKCLAFSLIGYFSNAIIFPQSVSIHPFLYDFLWINPLYLTCGYIFIRPLREIKISAFDDRDLVLAIIFMACLMSNLFTVSEELLNYL